MQLSMEKFDILVNLIINCVEQRKSYKYKGYVLRARRRRKDIIVFSLYRKDVLINNFVVDYIKKTFYLENKYALESESITDVLTICLDLEERKQ